MIQFERLHLTSTHGGPLQIRQRNVRSAVKTNSFTGPVLLAFNNAFGQYFIPTRSGVYVSPSYTHPACLSILFVGGMGMGPAPWQTLCG